MPSNLKLETGKYYRNILGDVVLIVGTVKPESKWYRRGFRFVDQRGSFYTEEGTVKSRLFAKLDLAVPVGENEIATDKLEEIEKQVSFLMKARIVAHRVTAACDTLIPYLIGANIALLVMRLAKLIRQRRLNNA